MLRNMNHTLKKHTSRAKLDLLRQVPTLANCTDKELNEVARHLDETSVAAGTVLTKEGTLGHEAFIILEGWAAVMIHDEPVAALGPGQLAGEMAMIDNSPRTATVVAKTDMRLLVIGPGAFASFAGQPAVARCINKTLSERLRRADEQLVSQHAEESEG
jgi:CRP-like cAMP-binding protein